MWLLHVTLVAKWNVLPLLSFFLDVMIFIITLILAFKIMLPLTQS